MAKFGGFPGGGMNMNSMLRQAQKMQEDMARKQAEVEVKEFTASSGGGAVTVCATGKRLLKSVTIKPEVCDPEDVDMLQDLVLSAANEALRQADDAMQSIVQGVGGGLPFSL